MKFYMLATKKYSVFACIFTQNFYSSVVSKVNKMEKQTTGLYYQQSISEINEKLWNKKHFLKEALN